jgi:hypothetical protein
MRWTGAVLAVLIGLALWLAGRPFAPLTWVALLVLAVGGALFPPAALVVGGVALLVVLMRYGQEVFGTLGRLSKRGRTG